MKAEKVLQADYLDIIFDQRNKKYGGYELRKHYNRRVGKAVLFLFLGMGALLSLSFITTDQAEQPHTYQKPNIICDIHPVDIPKVLPKIVPPPVTPPPPPRAVATNAFTIPKIVVDKDVPVDKPAIAITVVTAPGPSNATGDTTGLGTENVGGNSKTDVVIRTVVPPSIPRKWVEQMPEFNGDIKAYIGSHLKYPEVAHAESIQGRVVVQFVVNEDGSVSNATIVNGIGGGCDEEALRVVSGMPKWKPGRQNGIAVKVIFTLPIKFVLN